jgi:dolichol-phosphate mannosyltransferase
MAELLQVVIPVCNEAGSIEATLDELHSELGGALDLELIVCEDGSTDGTDRTLSVLQGRLPITVISSRTRKGYSRAVLDGLRSTTSDWVLCLDGDGQCDPRDFWHLWKERPFAEVITGNRTLRPEAWPRRFLSRTFRFFFSMMFETHIEDPSSPYVLLHQTVIRRLRGELGLFPQGFWWEFTARAAHCGFRLKDVPVQYRPRTSGETQVYRLTRIPKIGWTHMIGLLRLWWQLK